MRIPLPGGGEIDTGDNPNITYADNGRITLHTPLALSRLIEFWKNKPDFRALLSHYTDEIQLLENAIWDVVTAYFLDYAGTAQLDVLGRIVGEERNGLGNASYRVRIRARILINNSLGRARDTIGVLRMITSAPFHFRRYGTAAFRIDFDEYPGDALARQIPSIVEETSAAGVGSSVYFPTESARAGRYGWAQDPTLNAAVGYGWVADPSLGGLYGYVV